MTVDASTISAMTQATLSLGLNIVESLAVFFIGWWLSRRMSNFMGKVLQLRHVDKTFTLFFTRIIFYLLMVFVMMAVLSTLGVQTTSLVAVLGGMSIAVGLSLKSSLSNLASGILLIFFRPFKVGDSIKVGSDQGTVEEIQILFTTIRTSGMQQVTIPNNKFLTNSVTNFSVHVLRRADMVLGISYDDDIARAKSILWDMIQTEERIKMDPEPIVVVKELADSSVNVLARFFTDRSDYFNVTCWFNEEVKKRFDSASISMPYPQQDVHVFKSE